MADYDAVVIGAGLGGISTAALLAANGFKTLVPEQADMVGGCCSSFYHQDYKFDTGATMVMLIQPLQEIFRRLGRNLEGYIDLIPCGPIYSIHAFDGSRFTVPMDIEEAAAVIASIAPGDMEGWKKYVKVGLSMMELLGEMMLTPANTIAETVRMYRKTPGIMRYLPYMLRTSQGIALQWLHNPLLQSTVAFQAYCAGSPPDLGMGPSSSWPCASTWASISTWRGRPPVWEDLSPPPWLRGWWPRIISSKTTARFKTPQKRILK